MLRWIRISMIGLVAFVLISYAADWCVYRSTGSPKSAFLVSHFVSAPLKNNKEEIDFVGSEQVPCSICLYPHDGNLPCWYLRTHTNQVTSY